MIKILPYVSINTAASELGIDESTVRYRLRRGTIEHAVTTDGLRLIPLAAIRSQPPPKERGRRLHSPIKKKKARSKKRKD